MQLDASKYVNRELSWLAFNQRVLDEAKDPSIPLLERLKFLAITASNLDEFFMVRVGGLQLLENRGSAKRDPAGMMATEQLDAISKQTHEMVVEQYQCFQQKIEWGLADAGIRRVESADLNDRQKKALRRVFSDEVFGIFTPAAVHCVEQFPLLINRTLNLCVQLAPAPGTRATGGKIAPVGNEPRFAIIPFGRLDNRFVTLPAETGVEYMLLEDLACMEIGQFFPGEKVVQCVPFRITRNADLSVREDMAADLMSGMEDVLAARRLSDCVRIELSSRANKHIRTFLQSALGVDQRDVYLVDGPLDLSSFMQLAGVSGFDNLKYKPWPARPSPDVDLSASMFDCVRQQDILLSLPYESFEPVVRIIDEAADDADVLSIKIILYRTSGDSPIVAALSRAAAHGKHVTAIIELKARFDEARNIEWAKALELDGVQVIYGVKGLKTHAKVCIITRRESHGIQRYVHFSTGNYNEVTARLYSDISFLTCNDELIRDATAFFSAISGYSQPQAFRKIAIAPTGLRDRLLELIDSEIQRKRQGQKGHIMAQLNSLGDPKIINALYKASQAGVKIDLNVRGICCLRPGVDGLSENIRAVSILDRFLEHSRIIYFHHGGRQLVYISSADWMPRNLDRRVELLIPIEDRRCRDQLIEILKSYTKDNVKGRRLLPKGGYRAPNPPSRKKRHRHQLHLHQLAREAEKQAQQSQRTMFVPHKASSDEPPKRAKRESQQLA